MGDCSDFQAVLFSTMGSLFLCDLVAIVVPSLAEMVKSGHMATEWT